MPQNDHILEHYEAALNALSQPHDEITPSAYDIAVLSLVPGSQQKSCIQWLLNHQNADGTWGTAGYVSWYDRYICTYAVALALRNAGLDERAEQALRALSIIEPSRYARTPETLAFGGLVGVLDQFAQLRGWGAFQHTSTICELIAEEQDKWSRMLTWHGFYDPTVSIAGYCGERVFGDSRIDLHRFVTSFQTENASISTSVAASAMALLEAERRGDCLSTEEIKRLRAYIHSRNPFQKPIGYLDHIPHFITAWGFMFISELNIPYDPLRFPGAESRIQTMHSILFNDEKLRFLCISDPTTIPGDPDSTTGAILAIDYAGRRVANISKFNEMYLADKGYYQTFLYERDPSLSTNIHVAGLLSTYKMPQLGSVLRWLQHEVAQSGHVICKWHASPYYTMGEMARILAHVNHPIAQALALYAAEYLLSKQKHDGSWGIDGPTIEETGYAVLGLASVYDNLHADKDRHHSSFLHAIHNTLRAADAILQESSSYPSLWIGKSLYCVKPLVPVLQNVAAARIQQVEKKHADIAPASTTRRPRRTNDPMAAAHKQLESAFHDYTVLQKAHEVLQNCRSEDYLARTEQLFAAWSQPLAIAWNAELLILHLLMVGIDPLFETCTSERELERIADELSAIGRFNNAMLYLLSLPETDKMSLEEAVKIHLAFTTAAGYRRLQVFFGRDLADRWFRAWQRLISVHNQQQVEQCAAALSPDRYRPALILELGDAVEVYLDSFQHTGGLAIAVIGAFPFSQFASNDLLSGLLELSIALETLYRVVQDVNIDTSEVLNLGTFALGHERGITIAEAGRILRGDSNMVRGLESRLKDEEASYFARADYTISAIIDKYQDEKVRKILAEFSKVLLAIAHKLSETKAAGTGTGTGTKPGV